MSAHDGGSGFDDRFPPPQTSSEGGDASANAPLLVSGTGAGEQSAALGLGAVVGITLAAMVVLLVLLGAVFRFRHQRRLQTLATTKRDLELSAVETPYTTDAYAGYFRSAALSSTGGGARRLHDDDTTASSRDGERNSAETANSKDAAPSEEEAKLWADEQVLALRIPREQLAVGALLSRGGFGEVYAGEFSEQRVAVKTLLPHARHELRQLVARGHARVELSANAPQALVDLAAACTQLAPASRPSAVDVTYKLQQALRTYENFVF
ncbi:hypothetical protein PybrP1_002715 [[Pythium] brassicae (nom. inval.)]|nr:hypothetical protein PybrP1_002715 [[Pythium] brassicae (nom. inval.)]